jgi:amino acid adenylation domain-containing protein/FkbM family methyltransferase
MMGDNVIEGFRVSPQQKNTWLLQQYDGSLAYRAQCSITLAGKLNAQILRRAVQGIVDRHEILRTTFYLPAGMTVPFQVINGGHSLSWRTIDLTHLNATEQQLEVEQLFEEDGLLGFDLQRGPLLRLSLLTLSNSDHVLLLSLPSLCADASTLNNLIAEISRSYAKLITGEATAAEVQSYVQFSEWQNELLMEPAGEAGRDHWRKQHVSSTPEIRLPFERKPVESSRFAPAALAFEVRPDVASKMVDVVEKCGASVPGFLLTCWQVFLWRLVRQPDIVVGVVLDGRSFPELQCATGLFAKTLPVRCHFHDDSKFSEVLSQMDVAMRSAADWQDYFTAEQSEGLSKNRLESVIFPISFEFYEEASSRFDAEVSFSVLKQYVCIDRFNIKLSCVRRDGALTATLNYDPYLFSPDDIRRLAGEFPALLESAVKNPHASISELEVLSEAERQQLLFDFNNTRAGEIANSCFHELFQQQVGRTPNEVAVVCENEQLTYAELNLRANQLAHHLSGLGVGPEVPVALQVERSLEMIVGLVAILKAGGAYVPLDPALPKERLAAILEDSQTSIILTQRSLVENLPERQMRIICLDTDRHLIAQERRENPLVKTTLKDLAYIIFTSGSTGRPKGVAVEHGQLLHYLNGILNRLDLAVGSSFATVSTLAADLGNTAIFPALCTGGCLHIVTQERASDPDALAEYFRLHRIDCLKIVPSHLEALLFATHPENILSLQRLVLGGEACSWALIDKIQALSPNCSILNHYGPTETTIGVTTYAVANEFPGDRPAKPPIGRPIANSQTYVLDCHMQPVPIGVPGELYISGNGLARGYYNHPELTAEKFIPHPFSDEHGARLYKTGDRARYLPDGNIEFLGRTDSQIKLRGHRIEPGEIEAALREHPDIRESVVEVREDESEDKRLIGYVVAAPGSALSTNELRSVLQEKLPEYMIPFSFVFLDALPLTPNGKLDRKALPEAVAPQSSEAFAAPRTQTEELLASIWAEVLKIDKLGIYDNFFELGGHSLLAMRLISRIRDTFRLELPLRSLFEAPTVAGLAERIGLARAGETRIRDLPIVADPSDEEYPLTFSQERFWFLSQLEPNNLAYKATRGFRLSGPLNIDALEKVLWEIVRRHEILRTTYQLSNEYLVQRILDRWDFRLSIVDLTQISRVDLDAEVQRLFENVHRSLFDLSTDVLLRATLVRLSTDENVLLVDIHHVAWDHWCIQLFLRELSILYQEFTKGNPSPLTDLPVQYKHYALWQRKMFQGPDLESHLSYWKEQLADAPPFLELPTDHPRKPLHDRRGGRQAILLPSDLSSALRSLSRNTSVTFFMTLLAAFQTLLHRLTGEEDIVVGTPVAGRNRSETEGLLGLFLNSLALRTSLSGNPTFLELLARVREVALGAYDHQELPFEKLVETLQPERDLSRTPIFQVFINLYNFKEVGLEIDGLTVRPLKRLGEAVQQFDLEFYIREHDDGTQLSFGYDLDLFETSTIARMLSQFQTLLEGIVADPEQRITELPFLSEAEKHHLLVGWNETKREYPKDKSVHQLFEEQVKRTPDAVAVVFEEQELSYGELNGRANRLAHYLKKLGVGPETLVGICVERSVEMIVGLLGILKAGGAYVPLDPGYPKERLAFMLEDARTGVLLTQQGVLEGLPQPKGRVICLDGDWGEIEKESKENPEDEISGENLAYVIYTSGSTGNPKGVAVEHRQVLNYVLSILDRIELPRPQSFATVSTLAADLGNTVIFSSLCNGAALHVISRDRIADAEAMADYFSRHAIECLKIVPSHLAALQTIAHPEKVLPRKLLIIGGEAAPFPWVKSLQKQAPGCAILNHYGPTETTIGVATYRVEREPLSREMSVLPLGRPLSNNETYILDPYLNPVPIGIVGELYIGGRNLTRGYLHSPDLTAAKFVPHPFSDEPGARLYKSGDRARYLPDGNIEFLGRIDNQIKLRGHRIEPGEIEAALRQHPDIRESVVEAREDASGDKRLIAYVVASPDRAPTVGGKPRYRLPNGAVVAQLNKNETDYIYQEIFEHQAYLRHGITIKDGDCIFDVGANIGLFTLFAHQIAKQPRIYSFEPNPAVYEILQANAGLYGSDVKTFNCGLSNESKRATFTFFPGFSLLSGFYADAQADKEVVKTFMTNQRNGGIAEMAELVEQADGILAERFTPETFDAELRTLSDVIEQERIERIDLLKINVEKSELGVLAGIEERHWARIRQIVLEVDVKEHLPIITALLERRGYEYAVEQDDLLEGTSLCYLYAIRADADTVLLREQPHGAHVQPIRALNATVLSSVDLRAFLSAKLPEYMVPAAFVFLDALPLTLNGKLDRKALPEPVEPQSAEAFAAPRTQTEELLASIWADVLKIDKLGIHDNFFELGGHSLLATQVIARIRNTLSVELPLRRLFEYPTIHGLAKIISTERQPPQKRRLGVIVPASRDRDLPLSFAQQRLWFIDQLEPESSAYNVPRAWRLSGPLDLMALKRSVNEIDRRHEVLRTSFVTVDGQPLQRIRPSATLSLDLIRLEDIADREKESAIKSHVRKEFREPFDLARGPLLRVKLLRLAEDDHVLLLTMHHIVSDGWSAGVLFRELSRLYEAYAEGNVSPLEDLPLQYADYAVWQRGWLQGEVLESQLAYWRNQLENLTVLHLPTDRPRPPVQSYRGARARVQIDASLTKRLWALSRGENATPYITLLAAFQVLLSRYSGQEDIAVGSPIAFRSTPELERLIGFFANTLVLRGDLSNNPTFREFLRRVRNVALEAYAHQDLPFEKLVEDLRPRRDLNISPLFQVMLVMENNPREDLDLKGLKVTSVSIDDETTKFDLLLSLRESEFGLRGTLEYDADLFDSTTIDRMLAQFETLLRGIVADPDQRLLQLPLLTDGERHQLLSEWNETTREYPTHSCVHQLFEKQAETHPEKVAIVFEDRQMTYRELDVGSNQLARYLRKQGVGAESVVGVCLERSPEMIVAMLAVLKAGGAYLPMDPSYPTERLALMVEQAGALIILTQKSLLSVSPAGKGECHCLDNIVQGLTDEKQESLGNTSSPENAAYVLFTSGSTGVPKGVLMEHRPLVNLLSWQAEAYESFPTARTLQFAPLSFDVSFQEIFSALCFGGTLVMVGEAERRDAKALWPLLKEKAVERMFLPFIALQQLAEAAQDDTVAIENLREIITAGEQLQVTQAITDLFTRLPDCRLYNQYGPTESHVVTSFALGGDPADWPSLPPIGRPVANSKVYILDRCLQPVPVGVVGELYIGGDGLARGYVNQPGLSREKFISNPFIKQPGARLYRTGDLARYLADGNIQFVGRIDDQVKVRGFRIEPGEVETILCRHPEVLESVVSAREGASGGKWLVAHIVAGTAHDLNSGKLRDYLKEKLPEYMIPNVFMFLDSLPLTASGKVDRRRLPAPDGRGPDLAEAYSAPRNQTEELLTKIWAEVLKLDRIGIHDNFFDLGGHSLLATRVVSGIRKILHRELPLRALFETPTVAGLSKHIEATRCERDPNQRGAAEQTEETIL